MSTKSTEYTDVYEPNVGILSNTYIIILNVKHFFLKKQITA